jgi:hypothetical protein
MVKCKNFFELYVVLEKAAIDAELTIIARKAMAQDMSRAARVGSINSKVTLAAQRRDLLGSTRLRTGKVSTGR